MTSDPEEDGAKVLASSPNISGGRSSSSSSNTDDDDDSSSSSSSSSWNEEEEEESNSPHDLVTPSANRDNDNNGIPNYTPTHMHTTASSTPDDGAPAASPSSSTAPPEDQERQILIVMLLAQVCALHDPTPRTLPCTCSNCLNGAFSIDNPFASCTIWVSYQHPSAAAANRRRRYCWRHPAAENNKSSHRHWPP